MGAQSPAFLQGGLAPAEIVRFITVHNIHVNPIPL